MTTDEGLIERDIRIAVWNACRWQGMTQEVAQSFIRHLFADEPCMKRALSALQQPDDLLEELEQQADGTSTIISLLAGQTGPVAASLIGMLRIQEQAARAAIAKARGEA